jgi:hypothetical protein
MRANAAFLASVEAAAREGEASFALIRIDCTLIPKS